MANININLRDADWVKPAYISLKANRVPLVWGGPGIGKTDRAENEVHKLLWNGDPNAPFVAVAPSLSDPTDATGPLAVIADKAVRLLPEVMRPLVDAGKGTFFIDELTTATQATQAAFLRVVQNRIVGDTVLPADVRIIMAANPSDIAAGGSDLVVPMANRVVHMYAKAPEARDWGNWLCGKLIDSAEARKTASMFAAFMSANKQRLYELPEDDAKKAQAWPSPRSWHSAADCYAEAMKANDPGTGLNLVAGCVGEAAAIELATFLQNVDLPDPLELLTGRTAWKPERHRADRANAVLRAVASEAVNTPAKTRDERHGYVEKAWEIIAAACDSGLSDIAFNAVVPLNHWRLKKSGQPNAMFKVEAEVTPRFFQLMAATSAGGR
jgi:hypothetical protein